MTSNLSIERTCPGKPGHACTCARSLGCRLRYSRSLGLGCSRSSRNRVLRHSCYLLVKEWSIRLLSRPSLHFGFALGLVQLVMALFLVFKARGISAVLPLKHQDGSEG